MERSSQQPTPRSFAALHSLSPRARRRCRGSGRVVAPSLAATSVCGLFGRVVSIGSRESAANGNRVGIGHVQAVQSAGSARIGEMGVGFRGGQRDRRGIGVEIAGKQVAGYGKAGSLFLFLFEFYFVGIAVCFKPLSQSIFAFVESVPLREFDKSELFPLQFAEHFRVEWLDVSSQPISLLTPRFFASSEQTSQQVDAFFAAFPSHLRKLFRLAICQKSEASLRLFADLFTRVPFDSAQLVLDFLLLLQHSLVAPTRSAKPFPATFVVHRTVFYCIQRILILHGKQLASSELLGFTFRHAFVALREYTEKTEKAVQNPLISEKTDEKINEKEEELTATQLAHVTTSAAHVAAFCICLEIQHVKPVLKEKVVDLNVHKSDSFLPELCSVLGKYCDYSEIITEKKERNRYYIASLLQCVTLVLQSIDAQYSTYVFKTFYPHLILILSYEKDNLLVSLSLTVRLSLSCVMLRRLQAFSPCQTVEKTLFPCYCIAAFKGLQKKQR